MGFIIGTNPFYRDKEPELPSGSCKLCVNFNSKTKMCSRYNMITESWKTCKSCKEKGE